MHTLKIKYFTNTSSQKLNYQVRILIIKSEAQFVQKKNNSFSGTTSHCQTWPPIEITISASTLKPQHAGSNVFRIVRNEQS